MTFFPLQEVYYEIAEKFQPYGFFYCISHDLIQEHVSVKSQPAIFVYKENTAYFYEGNCEEKKNFAPGEARTHNHGISHDHCLISTAR